MEFVTFNKLRELGNQVTHKHAFLESRKTETEYNTFLSHSSADDGLLAGIIKLLEQHGSVVYTDDGDKRLPLLPSPTTAKILKDTVKNCKKMVLFVTPNSKNSKWIPWELGLGDGMKSSKSIALFPSAENASETSWADQEYLGLYQKIVWSKFKGKKNSEWMVLDHHSNRGTELRKWFLS